MHPSIPDDLPPSDTAADAEPVEDGAGDGDATDATPDAEQLSLLRLGMADAWVRAGLAEVAEGAVRLTSPSPAISLVIPLPPAPFRFELEIALPGADGAAYLAIVETLRSLLPGKLELVPAGEGVRLSWTPSLSTAVADAAARGRAAAEHLAALAAEPAGEGSLAQRLGDALDACSDRLDALLRAFPLARAQRVPQIGRVHWLDCFGSPDTPEGALVLTDSDLLAPALGRGTFFALRPPDAEGGARRAALLRRLSELTARRLGLRLAPSDAREVLGPDWSDPEQTLLWSVGEEPHAELPRWRWRLQAAARFFASYLELIREEGEDPFVLLGIEDPGPGDVPVAEPVPPVEREPAPIPAEAPRVRPAESEVREPSSRPPQRPEPRPRPQAPPAGEPRPDLDRLTTREVVQRLGLQEAADVDVFMTHPGYNPQKTIDIMAIALSMGKDRAKQLVEAAPTLVVGPVTRMRAVQVKTILEGTGATIKVIPTGSPIE